MTDYTLFRILHLLGIFLLFAALGGVTLRRVLQGPAGPDKPKDGAAKLAGATHGLALVILLITGFTLLVKLGLGLPAWAWAKLLIWLVMGGIVVAIRKSTAAGAVWLWWLLPALGLVAAWLALVKPF